MASGRQQPEFRCPLCTKRFPGHKFGCKRRRAHLERDHRKELFWKCGVCQTYQVGSRRYFDMFDKHQPCGRQLTEDPTLVIPILLDLAPVETREQRAVRRTRASSASDDSPRKPRERKSQAPKKREQRRESTPDPTPSLSSQATLPVDLDLSPARVQTAEFAPDSPPLLSGDERPATVPRVSRRKQGSPTKSTSSIPAAKRALTVALKVSRKGKRQRTVTVPSTAGDPPLPAPDSAAQAVSRSHPPPVKRLCRETLTQGKQQSAPVVAATTEWVEQHPQAQGKGKGRGKGKSTSRTPAPRPSPVDTATPVVRASTSATVAAKPVTPAKRKAPARQKKTASSDLGLPTIRPGSLLALYLQGPAEERRELEDYILQQRRPSTSVHTQAHVRPAVTITSTGALCLDMPGHLQLRLEGQPAPGQRDSLVPLPPPQPARTRTQQRAPARPRQTTRQVNPATASNISVEDLRDLLDQMRAPDQLQPL